MHVERKRIMMIRNPISIQKHKRKKKENNKNREKENVKSKKEIKRKQNKKPFQSRSLLAEGTCFEAGVSDSLDRIRGWHPPRLHKSCFCIYLILYLILFPISLRI